MWGRLPAFPPAAGLLAAYLLVGAPVSGFLLRRRFAQQPPHSSDFRRTTYRRTIRGQWLLAAAALAAAGLARTPPSALGLRGPRVPGAGPAAAATEAALLVVVAIAVAVLSASMPQRGAAGLLPATRDERRLYAAVALTAGVVEELLFRGFLMAYAVGGLGWSWQQAALASAIAFGLGHGYQGPAAAAAAALIGFGFAESFILTGSLLVPVLLHAALDLRVLAARPGGGQKCSGVNNPSSRSPVWNTCGSQASVPSPATKSSVGAVADA